MSNIFEKDIENIIEFINQARYLAAHKLYIEIINKLDNADNLIKEDDKLYIKNELQENSRIQLLLKRIIEIEKALEYQDSSNDWIVGSVLFGITTYYKRSMEDNTITIKMEGIMDNLPILEQFSVIREIDLFNEWVPFCSKSVMVDKIGQSEYFAYIDVGLPVFSRDFLMSAYAADLVLEHNKVIILGESIDYYPLKEVPFQSIGWFHNRMIVKDFKAIIEIISPDSAKTMIISKVDLKAPLPQSLINYLIRNLAGILLYLLQQQALKVKNTVHCNHAKRIREDIHFYKNWLLPKFRLLCEIKGWTIPRMAYFDDEDDNIIDSPTNIKEASIDHDTIIPNNTESDPNNNEIIPPENVVEPMIEGNNNITYDNDIDQENSYMDTVKHNQSNKSNINTTTVCIDNHTFIDLYNNDDDDVCRSKKPSSTSLIDIHTNISFIVHKPVGTICSTVDPTINNRKPKHGLNPSKYGKKTLYKVVEESGFPINLGLVGRLDLETSGIMLFTNDSRLSNAILRPLPMINNNIKDLHSTTSPIMEDSSSTMDDNSYKMLIKMKSKVYLLGMLQGKESNVYLENNIFNIQKFENEFGKSFEFIRNGHTIHVQESNIKFLKRYQHEEYSHGGRNHLGWCIETLITIYEGKHHQIRRMALKNGYRPIYLKRLEICNSILNLDGIPNPGDCRWLTIEEKIKLYHNFQLM